MYVSLKLFHTQVFIAIAKKGRHGLLPTSLAAMSVFVELIFFAGVVRLYYHVALNQPLHQQVALFSIHCYVISGFVWILFLK